MPDRPLSHSRFLVTPTKPTTVVLTDRIGGWGERLIGFALPLLLLQLYLTNPSFAQNAAPQTPTVNQTRFDRDKAFTHLENICRLGRRFSTSRGMTQQRDYLKKYFESIGAEVFMQPFSARDPRNGRQVELANLVVRFDAHRKKRLLLCCHYDTRPFPDRDRRDPHGVFIGANDGGSGVAILCELGRHLTTPSTKTFAEAAPSGASGTRDSPKVDDGFYGIDCVFFDGEEFVFVDRRDPLFLGSTHFANAYVAAGAPPKAAHDAAPHGRPHNVALNEGSYLFAILIDMVGDKNLQLYFEGNSLKYAPRLTRSIWGVASRMKAKSFIPEVRHEIRDDHLPLNQIARIPTCDIIDFDFPSPRRKNVFWHTEQDVVENCSAQSLGTVGAVLLQWIDEMQQLSQTRPAQPQPSP